MDEKATGKKDFSDSYIVTTISTLVEECIGAKIDLHSRFLM